MAAHEFAQLGVGRYLGKAQLSALRPGRKARDCSRNEGVSEDLHGWRDDKDVFAPETVGKQLTKRLTIFDVEPLGRRHVAADVAFLGELQRLQEKVQM